MPQPTIAALVPMRHSSERLPGKNWRPFGGRPLFHWIIRTLLDVPEITTIAVDTDSPVIADDCASAFPTVRIIERPEHLRAGTVPMNDVILHDIAQVPADLYLQTHSTNPLLRAPTIRAAIRRFVEGRATNDSLFGVTRMQTRLYDAHAKPINHDPAILLRTQDLPPVYEENSNIYLFTESLLRRTGTRIGNNPILFEIDRLEAIDIDDDAGWRLAEAVLAATPLDDRPPAARDHQPTAARHAR